MKNNWPVAVQLIIVGFYVAFSLIVPTIIGLWLDTRVSHSLPVYALVGLGFGTVLMIYGVYLMVRPFLREAKHIEEIKKGQDKEETG